MKAQLLRNIISNSDLIFFVLPRSIFRRGKTAFNFSRVSLLNLNFNISLNPVNTDL